MTPPKTVTINSLGSGAITITLKVGWRLKARIRIAVALMWVAARVLGKRLDVKEVGV